MSNTLDLFHQAQWAALVLFLHWSRAQIWSWHWYQWWDKFVVLVSWSCKITCNQLNFAFLLGVTCMHQEMSKRDRPFLWNGFKCEMASRSVTSRLSIYCSPISFGWSSLKNFYKVVMQILQLRGWFCVCVCRYIQYTIDIYIYYHTYIIRYISRVRKSLISWER